MSGSGSSMPSGLASLGAGPFVQGVSQGHFVLLGRHPGTTLSQLQAGAGASQHGAHNIELLGLPPSQVAQLLAMQQSSAQGHMQTLSQLVTGPVGLSHEFLGNQLLSSFPASQLVSTALSPSFLSSHAGSLPLRLASGARVGPPFVQPSSSERLAPQGNAARGSADSSPTVSDTSCRPSTGKPHSASLAALQRNPQQLQLQHMLGSKRSSSASESPLHASAAGSGSKRRGGAGSTFPPDAAAAAAAAEAEAKRDKEKNRQAQQRFRERQKELIQNLREEVGQLQKKLSDSETRIRDLELDNITLKAKLEAWQGTLASVHMNGAAHWRPLPASPPRTLAGAPAACVESLAVGAAGITGGPLYVAPIPASASGGAPSGPASEAAPEPRPAGAASVGANGEASGEGAGVGEGSP